MQAQSDYAVVRLRRHDDRILDSLKELHQALRAYHSAEPQTEQFAEFVAKRLADEDMLLVFSLAGDTPVGYGMAFDVSKHPFMPDWQRAGYITQLFVAPEHRQRGVGRLLLNTIVQWLTSRGVTHVLLNVSVGNEVGDRFWRANGFAPYQIRMKRTTEP